MNFIELENSLASGFTMKRPLALASGKGANLYDADGREYIDCMAGIGVANIGHSHPVFLERVRKQMERLVVCHELFHNEERALYMEKLKGFLPPHLGRLFLCNSGTEANEAAIKLARFLTGRERILALKKGYHGRSLGSLQPTWEPKYKEFPGADLHVADHVKFGDAQELQGICNDSYACLILEVIQGEGGVHVADPGYFRLVRELCDRYGILLIVDEVQTGFGRTGSAFASAGIGLDADILTVAKGMAGGIPAGAMAFREAFRAKVEPGLHSSTFGGNPLICAAGSAVIDILRSDGLVEMAAENGAWFMGELGKLSIPLVREVRGMGLMIGIELKRKSAPYIKALMEEGILIMAAGTTTLRMLPPLCISRGQLQTVLEKLDKVLRCPLN